MPVEIRELIIRAVTTQDMPDSEEREGFGDQSHNGLSAGDQQAIIQECVRQVLRNLQQKKER